MTLWLQTWMPLLSTVTLVGITAWYALLTRSLAKSARDSARSAEKAAEHAARSVAAVIAGVNVSFEVGPIYTLNTASTEGPTGLGVMVRCTGATVFVHGASLRSAHRSVARDDEGEEFDIVHEFLDLEPNESVRFPERLHPGEEIAFMTSPQVEVDSSVALLEVDVRYSLDGAGDGIEREVTWFGQAGKDYEDPGPKGAPEARP